jgi:hypothetical protein
MKIMVEVLTCTPGTYRQGGVACGTSVVSLRTRVLSETKDLYGCCLQRIMRHHPIIIAFTHQTGTEKIISLLCALCSSVLNKTYAACKA